MLVGAVHFFGFLWKSFKRYAWPSIRKGSRNGSKAIMHASKNTGKNIQAFATSQKTLSAPSDAVHSLRSRIIPSIGKSIFGIRGTLKNLPRTSKIFGVVSVLLVIALVVSVLLLQNKRTADEEIQRASEILHDARTKTDAAKTALIYDNREQARGLLDEAKSLVVEVEAMGLYIEEVAAMHSDITTHTDRLARITRILTSESDVVGDFTAHVSGKALQRIFVIGTSIFTYNPDNNAIIKMNEDGSSEVVHQTTQGIGFLSDGAVHSSDKTIVFITEPAGIALFDAKDSTLLRQNIQLQGAEPDVKSITVFGNRLYAYDAEEKDIFSYNKTLRGYSSGSPWIKGEDISREGIKSIAIDGNVFALYSNGTIVRMFKGESADFTQEKVDPALSSATRIITTDDFRYIYVLDVSNKRVVIYTKKGALIRQLYIEAENLIDIAIDPSEEVMYALDGTRVLKVVLVEEEEE